MPIQPTYPGVYIQEVPSGVRTITGVSTSIGAFFGRTLKGPINKAVRCLSYSDFLREFGGAHPMSDLAANVRQFFDNGGTDCYVVRLARNPGFASVTLHNSDLTATGKNADRLQHGESGRRIQPDSQSGEGERDHKHRGLQQPLDESALAAICADIRYAVVQAY
jgi:hypothetical protein